MNILSPTLAQDLRQLKQYKKFVGFRKILDFSENDWLIRDDVIKGLKILADHQLTFDLLVSLNEKSIFLLKFIQYSVVCISYRIKIGKDPLINIQLKSVVALYKFS